MSVLKGLLLLGLLAITAASSGERIIGGPVTTVDRYPFAVLSHLWINNAWYQNCGGTIINNRSILTAAHCFLEYLGSSRYRIRSGSSFASNGGNLHAIDLMINHPNYNSFTLDNDISIVRVTSVFAGITRPAAIAGHEYNVADDQLVWVLGWGQTSPGGPLSEQLRHVQVKTVNQNTCARHYSRLTDNMVCAGWSEGGKGPCSMDSGGPLLHNNVVFGVVSFTDECASPVIPTVYARVSRYTSWIEWNA